MTYIISHSDAEQHSRCEWAHHYGYGYNLIPNETPEHLQIGVMFHKMIAEYYRAIKDGHNWDDACDAGMQVYIDAVTNRTFDFGVVNQVKELFDTYVGYYKMNEWEILWVEEYIEFPATDQYILNGEIDLVIRAKSGALYGRLGIVDHKTCYNFMTNAEISTHSQIPKYIYAINKLGIFDQKITFGILNQVRWRSVNDINKLFSRIVLEPSEIKQAAFIAEYVKQCRRIAPKRDLPDPYFWKDYSARTTIKDICKYCDFESLCVSELEGGNPEIGMKAHFKKKDLSYRENRKRVNGQPRDIQTDDSSDS